MKSMQQFETAENLAGVLYGVIVPVLLKSLDVGIIEDMHAILLSFACAAAGWLGTLFIRWIWYLVFWKVKKKGNEQEY